MPEIETKMKSLGFERTDGGVVQFASNVPRDVEHSQAHNLIGDAARNRGQTLSDQRVHCLGGLALGPDRIKVENITGARNRVTLHAYGIEVDKEPALSVRAVVGLIGSLTPDI